ncbi:MAG: 30S ribosomal protein S6 [Deltaproteobacteria bacterium]|nr:MAG: 30S ribosomal protein S6 [Deltaproteobacteria bacterium]
MAKPRIYETTWILKPDVTEEDKAKVLERVTGILTEAGGEIRRQDEWGRRRLAYPIDKQNHGIYIYLRYVAPGEVIQEIERRLRLMDAVLKFLTVKLEEERDIVFGAEGAYVPSESEEDEDDEDDEDDDD